MGFGEPDLETLPQLLGARETDIFVEEVTMAILVQKAEKQWQKKRRALRDQIWSDGSDVVFVAPRDEGYCRVVPRIVSLVGVLADHVKKRSGGLTATYIDLWLRTDNDGFVEVEDELECAACAGFLRGRALWSWRERVRELHRLGLIRVKEEGHREIRYILLLNPYDAVAHILEGQSKSVPRIWKDYYDRRRREIDSTSTES
jgi:hypothetical protein